MNLSLGKNWRILAIGEQGRLQFRAEAFNAFNSPQFGRPNGLSYVSLDSVVPDARAWARSAACALPCESFNLE